MLNDLMNNRHCSVRFLEPELQWSDTRVDHGLLTRPILSFESAACGISGFLLLQIGTSLGTAQHS